jgi:uncharacterized membrane protein (UPF0127 family)
MADVRRLTREGRVVCERCRLARTPFTRMKGLLGRRELPIGEGLLIEPTSGVHTAFMRFPIDVVFLDRDLRVLSVRPAVRPWRAATQRGARAALELPAGEAERQGLVAGDVLRVE